MEPAGSIIKLLEQLESEHQVELSFAMGFSAADFAECGSLVSRVRLPNCAMFARRS